MNRGKRDLEKKRDVPAFFSPDVAEARRFFLDLSPAKDRPLAVVCGGREHCTPGYSIRRDTFPFYSFEYVLRGRGELSLKGRTFELKPGRIFTYGPGVPHRILGEAEDPLVKYFVDFAGSGAMAFMKSCHLLPGRVQDVFPPHLLQPLFDELIENGVRVRRESPELCVKLLECLALRISGARASMEGAETMAFFTYEHGRRHIEQNFLRLRTLQQIASECHVHPAYLCRLFRRYDHQSPYQYLLHLKMSYSAGRLHQSGSLVKQAAEAAGFGDPFHFSRVFRKVMGLSPAAFRKLR